MSLHVARSQRPRLQNAEMQSPSLAQRLESGQPAQSGPPQSTSVSMKSFMLSEQLAAIMPQTLFPQCPDVQSEPILHSDPSGHAWQLPPQSIPVSLPFLIPSLQLGCGSATHEGPASGGDVHRIPNGAQSWLVLQAPVSSQLSRRVPKQRMSPGEQGMLGARKVGLLSQERMSAARSAGATRRIRTPVLRAPSSNLPG
jgi:hypothetical protein